MALIWAVLEPVLAILILTALFYVIVPAPPLGDSFALFYASGVVPLMALQTVMQKMAIGLRANRTLLAFGRVGVVEVALAQFLSVALVQAVAGWLVIVAICSLTGWSLVGPFAHILTGLAVLCFGAGLFSFWLGALFQSWPRVLAMILRPMVLVSGVFFLINGVGAPFADWLMWNPIVHVIMAFREGVYGFYTAPVASSWIPLLCGLMLACCGALGMRLSQGALLDRVQP